MERNLQLGESGEIDAKESIRFWIAQPQLSILDIDVGM
jgi:hypothetical protein